MHLKSVERASSQLVSGYGAAELGPRPGRTQRRDVEPSRSMFDQLVELGGKFLSRGLRSRQTAIPTATELLFPTRPGLFNIWERRAVAAFAATLSHHRRADQYVALLTESGEDGGMLGDLLMSGQDLSRAVLAEAERLRHDPAGPQRYRVSDALRQRLGDRLAAALEHAWLLAARRDERGARDQAARLRLTRAGWSAPEIAMLEQIVRLLVTPRHAQH